MTYVISSIQVNERKGLKGVPEVKQAFEFTLGRIGQDINAGAIYQEFVSFLQSPKPGTPAYRALYSEEGLPGQEDAHRIAILRFVARVVSCSVCIDVHATKRHKAQSAGLSRPEIY